MFPAICRSRLLLSVGSLAPYTKTTSLYTARVLKRYNSKPASLSPTENGTGIRIEPRLSITFTCQAPGCDQRSTHQFSKASYEKGIVIIQCPHCKNRHLIADHLGWFKDQEGTQGGKLRTIEDFMREKGEKVRMGKMNADGVVEYVDE